MKRLVAVVGLVACAFGKDAQDRSDGVALLKRATRLHADQQYARAIATYDSAARELPRIRDWITVFAASSASFLGDTAQVRMRLSSVDDSLQARWGWRSRARAFEKAGMRTRAIEIARSATRSGPQSRRDLAWVTLADLQPALIPSERVNAARAFFRRGDTGSGIKQMVRAIVSGELSPNAVAQARYELGGVYFRIGRYKDAITVLERIPRGNARRPDAQFLVARSRYRNGQPEEGKRTFRNVASAYPRTAAATRALFFLADLAHDEDRLAEATRLFAQVVRSPATTKETALAMMRLGGIAYLQGDYARAARLFNNYRARFPDGDLHDQATYWTAQSLRASGDSMRAVPMLARLRRRPVSYYSMLANRQIDAKLPIDGLPAGPVTPQAVKEDVERILQRWQLLREVGWNEAAAFELARVKGSVMGNLARYELAEQMHARGAPHLAIAAGRDLLNDGIAWDRRLLRILYPLPYRALIEREARTKGIDPYFVAALIRQESSFNPEAVSGAGAVGLMQVMPATGRHLSRKRTSLAATIKRLKQPEVNVTLGTRFLADMLEAYGNRADVVLVAYNAGPTRASRWRKFPEFKNKELFVERIPFGETRDYVKVVQLNAAIYRALYAD